MTIIPTLVTSQLFATATIMLNLSTQKIKELQGFLNDKLLQFSSDEHTPTINCVFSPTLLQFMAKELDELFNTAFEQHENEYNSNRNTATTTK